MYDYTHGESDSIERITHSICTLEFENHRALYDWFIQTLGIYAPAQYEFARLNLTYTVMSKRRLLELVQGKYVSGWDDPRMPTICGLRRRGYTPESLRLFCERIGVAKFYSTIEVNVLEGAVRDDLNKRALRRMAVLKPVKVVIENWPEGKFEEMEAGNNPEDPTAGTRKILFGRELYIEQEDFREEPPKKFHRLYPGNEVRLRAAYIIKCVGLTKDEKTGEVIEVRCTYDPETKSGMPLSDRKVKGTIHWVSAAHAVSAEIRVYDHLFNKEDPSDVPPGGNYLDNLNPNSLELITDAKLEPSLGEAKPGDRFQFERTGYFCVDKDSTPGKLVFNRTASLRDTWAKIEKKG
jgi:glutaminyl-tRNA synthetase